MNKYILMRRIFLLVGLIFLESCAPRFVKGYNLNKEDPISPSLSLQDEALSPDESEPKNKLNKRATIYPINKHTYNFLIADNDVWNATIDILMQNYNLVILDRENGLLTTEWDSFYYNNDVFRNKISVRIMPSSYKQTYFTIINNVETLKSSYSEVSSRSIGGWLPAQDLSGESRRIIKSIAAALQQPPPVFPPDALAESTLSN